VGIAFVAIAAASTIAALHVEHDVLALAAWLAPTLVVVKRVVRRFRPIAELARRASAAGNLVRDQIAKTRPEIIQEQQDIDAKQASLASERQQARR
jgi:hypothetical protein